MEESTLQERAPSAESPSSDELLSQLMTALAAGARAVQGLPMEDEFEFQSSFPEFQRLIRDTHDQLLDNFALVLGSSADNQGDSMVQLSASFPSFQGLDDPLLWEACSDVCDTLLEQAESTSVAPQLQSDLVDARSQARKSFGRLLQGIVEMEKPQEIFRFYQHNDASSGSHVNDRRVEPFVPPIGKKYHDSQTPLDLTLQPGHGLDTRFGTLSGRSRLGSFLPDNLVAPSQHVPHVYQAELEALQLGELSIAAPETKPDPISVTTPLAATWVDTPNALQELASQLENCQEIAMDLEAHSYRTFTGITCLIQITIGKTPGDTDQKNFLIDPFPIWKELGDALGPTLADPNIVKVMHGAESDVQWLQRDFGLYIVNLFDTYYAARALQLSRKGYAYLLHHYVGITADKSHQLSDWRQRPLPPAMKEYAIMDTHYLLDIYQHLKFDLDQHKTATISEVLEESRKVCMIRYAPEPFRPDGYRALMNRRGSKTELSNTQELVLKDLWDWRDQMARECDESLAYVCTNNALVRLALACPTTLTALQGLLQPLPPLILRHAKQVLGLVQRRVKSPFFKPAQTDQEESVADANRLLSPVLGTEALYRQAGWVSPHMHDKPASTGGEDVVTTTEDDEDNQKNEVKTRRVLVVHEANQKYASSQFTSHSLHLGEDDEDVELVDGMGPARATHPQDMEVESQLAQTAASSIRSAQESQAMMGLISPTTDMEDQDADDEGDEEEVAEKAQDTEEFEIPRSMREIYRISNRNRRNKKSASPLPPELNEKDAKELAEADEILKTRSHEGKSYFDEILGTPKRQRTKSTGTASQSSEEAPPGNDLAVSREEDVALMQDIGWVKDKEEVESMMKQRDSAGEGDEDGDPAQGSSEEEGTKQPKPFPYANVGTMGAFSATPSANPFFTGAATAGGHINQQFGKTEPKKKQTSRNSKQSRRQVERPERREGRSQTYKKR